MLFEKDDTQVMPLVITLENKLLNLENRPTGKLAVFLSTDVYHVLAYTS